MTHNRSKSPMNKCQRRGPDAGRYELLTLYRGEWASYLLGNTAPDLPNPMIRCACGCGQELRKYDANRRARTYARGHGNARRKNAKVAAA